MIHKFWVGFDLDTKRILYVVHGTVRMDVFATIISNAGQEICTFLMYVVPGTVYSYYDYKKILEDGSYSVILRNSTNGFEECRNFKIGLQTLKVII